MKVLKFLEQVAAKAKLIQIADDTKEQQSQTVSFETTVISLSQLIIEKEEEADNNAGGPELNVSFENIYNALKVAAPQDGWNVDKVLQTLAAEDIKDLSSDKAKKVIKEILVKNNIGIQEIIKDAVNRDKALDTYEQFVYSKLQERTKSRDNQIEELKRQIEDCNKNIGQLEALQSKDKNSFQQWVVKKVEKEEVLVKVVGLLTSDSLISIGQVTPKNRK